MDIRRIPVRDAGGVPQTRHGLRPLPAPGERGARRGFLTALLLAGALLGYAAPVRAELEVSRYAFARDVVAREPVGESQSFPADAGEVYFYTQLMGAAAPTSVLHVWIYDGRELAVVPLQVEGATWRTWSRKRIPPELVGDWTVEVRDSTGRVLVSATFRIE